VNDATKKCGCICGHCTKQNKTYKTTIHNRYSQVSGENTRNVTLCDSFDKYGYEKKDKNLYLKMPTKYFFKG
jgi:hypothetical protein